MSLVAKLRPDYRSPNFDKKWFRFYVWLYQSAVNLVKTPQVKRRIKAYLKTAKAPNDALSFDQSLIPHFQKTFLKFANRGLDEKILREFFETEFVLRQKNVSPETAAEAESAGFPVVICRVFNEEFRIPLFLDHYHKLGARHFVFVENGSTDRTIEILKREKDVDLYSAVNLQPNQSVPFTKLSRVLAHYAADAESGRWFLYVDCDELLDYAESENHDLNDLTKLLESRRLTRANSLMLDMYSRRQLVDDQVKTWQDVERVYNWFDKDSLTPYGWPFGPGGLRGGPRSSLNQLSDLTPKSKHSLVFARSGDFLTEHTFFPALRNLPDSKNKKFEVVLRHYKFLPTDIAKTKEVYRTGKADSLQGAWLDPEDPEQNRPLFRDGQSAEFCTSADLAQVKAYSPIAWPQ